MIPKFPQFKKIELSDRVDVEAHTSLFEPYSDFEFTCLWTWDMKGERMISELNNNLVVRFTDYNTHNPFLSFLGVIAKRFRDNFPRAHAHFVRSFGRLLHTL